MLKILLVEDSLDIQLRLLDMLIAVPGVCVVGCAASADQALAMAGQRCPDVVLLDIALRDGDHGCAVLTRLAKACPGCQVVVLSNFGWAAMRDAFLKAGACAYFDKAFGFGKARDWVAAQAGQHQAT